MEYIVISDYPHYTSKEFFEDLAGAEKYWPDQNKLLASWVYKLTSYKETVNDKGKVMVSYGVDIPSRKQKYRHLRTIKQLHGKL